MDVSCCRLIMHYLRPTAAHLPTRPLHLTLLLFVAMMRIPTWVWRSNLGLHNAPLASRPHARCQRQSWDVQSVPRNGTRVKSFSLGVAPGPWTGLRRQGKCRCRGWGQKETLTAAWPMWCPACKNRGALMTLARFHSRVFSPLRVYEVWKSIRPGLDAPPPALSSPPSPPLPKSPVDCASWAEAFAQPDVWSCPVGNCLLLPRLRRQSMSSSGLLTGAAVLTLPAVAVEILFFLFSARKRWKRSSRGNKTPSILVNVKGPLCLHWYFTSEPFRRAQPSADASRWHRQKTADVSPPLRRRYSN